MERKQKMKTTNGMLLVLAVAALLASDTGAAVTAVSDDATLDTRSLSTAADEMDQGLDSRSFTVEWSEAHKLNTKKIVGTMVLVR
jgi:hypothetical protein